MFRAVKDVAGGEISIEELTKALHDAVANRNLRLIAQGAFHNVPEEPRVFELNMEAFNRWARAITIGREREQPRSCATPGPSYHRISTLLAY
jgi:hypothetical protein